MCTAVMTIRSSTISSLKFLITTAALSNASISVPPCLFHRCRLSAHPDSSPPRTPHPDVLVGPSRFSQSAHPSTSTSCLLIQTQEVSSRARMKIDKPAKVVSYVRIQSVGAVFGTATVLSSPREMERTGATCPLNVRRNFPSLALHSFMLLSKLELAI